MNVPDLVRRASPLRDGALAVGFAVAASWPAAAAEPAPRVAVDSLADLTLEQLADVEVTSVTGRPTRVLDAAASVYVITGEDIRRSAATSLPEALRLAPNLQVARLNAGQYAITARGFNNAIGNKLLVLIDGRTVYSPLFSGVFWDQQDVVLSDIERIEVISGPGATLWGANAVNGVINVITRSARDTEGMAAVARAGGKGGELDAQVGAPLGGNGHGRAYVLQTHRDNTTLVNGTERPDSSTKTQLGFRSDWQLDHDRVTFQGDAYRAGSDSKSNLAPRLTGSNLLGRWERQYADGSNWQLQAYYDQSAREDDVLFHDHTRLYDVEFTQVPVIAPDHKVIWGAGYRWARDEATPTLALFMPQARTLQWSNVFVQDEIRVREKVDVTVGVKLETNVFTGLEVLPTLRAAYKLDPTRTLWASASRAVRAPARIDRDFYFPSRPPYAITGGPDFESETADIFELGYRAQASAARATR